MGATNHMKLNAVSGALAQLNSKVTHLGVGDDSSSMFSLASLSASYDFNETSGDTASDGTGSNDATFGYTGNQISTGLRLYYPFIDGDLTDNTNNTHNGTLSTNVVIDNLDSTSGWTNATINSTNYLYGTGALSINGGFTSWRTMDKSISSTNLSNRIVTVHVYFESQTVIDNLNGSKSIEFSYGSDSSNRYKYSFSETDMHVGWNVLKVDIDNPNETSLGTPPATSNITWIRLAISTSIAFSTGAVVFDYIQYGAPVLATDHLGNEKGAYYFSGPDDGSYLDYATNDFELTDGQNATIGLWFKSGGTQRVENNYIMAGTSQWAFYIDYTSTTWGWYIQKADGDFRYGNTTASNHMDGDWHRLIITLNSSRQVRLYEDGVLVGSHTYASSVFDAITNSLIGSWQTNYGNCNGYITDVFFLQDYAMKANEVADDYTAGLVHKWADKITDGETSGKAVRINGLSQYNLSTPITLSKAGSKLKWSMYVSQNMLDYGNILFSSSWKSGYNHIVFKMNASNSLFLYIGNNVNGSGISWAQPTGFTTGWHDFELVFFAGQAYLYVDDVLIENPDYFGNSDFESLTDVVGIDMIGGQGYDYNYGDIIWWTIDNLEFYANWTPDLGNEVYREALFDTDLRTASLEFQIFMDKTENNGTTMNEVAMYDASSGGKFYGRKKTVNIDKDSTKEVFVGYKITLSTA